MISPSGWLNLNQEIACKCLCQSNALSEEFRPEIKIVSIRHVSAQQPAGEVVSGRQIAADAFSVREGLNRQRQRESGRRQATGLNSGDCRVSKIVGGIVDQCLVDGQTGRTLELSEEMIGKA